MQLQSYNEGTAQGTVWREKQNIQDHQLYWILNPMHSPENGAFPKYTHTHNAAPELRLGVGYSVYYAML